MAHISKDDITIELSDNSSIREACEKLDVLFGCRSGLCGTCQIEIKEGQENLDELTQEEQDMGMDRNHRLACQCKIKEGKVILK